MSTQRELAKTERELYEAATPEEAAGGIATFIHKLSGARRHDVTLRSVLFRAGAEADALWDAVDAEIRPLGLSQACDMLREARETRRPVADLVADWRRFGKARKAKTSPRAPKRCPSDQLAHVRAAIAAWVENEIPKGDGESATVAAQLSAEIEGTLRAARDRFRHRAALPGELGTLTSDAPTRADVRAACSLLGLEVPRHRGAFDMVAVNRARRGMLKASHPDVVGDDSKVDAYQAVNDAYNVIVRYNDSVARSGRRNETEKESGNDTGADHGQDHSS